MMTINRRPSRAAVIRSLREARVLWKPPAVNDNARLEPGAGETVAERGFDREKDTMHGASRSHIRSSCGDLAICRVAP